MRGFPFAPLPPGLLLWRPHLALVSRVLWSLIQKGMSLVSFLVRRLPLGSPGGLLAMI
jgi:hypothetical protein